VSNFANAAEAVPQRRSLHIVFASTSGHTEYVVEALIDSLKSATPGWEIEETMAEKTGPQDLLRGDILLLASSTWNTGSIEGQLNPHMWVLLNDKAKTLDLAGKPCACIGLGDHRYFYTARAADHLQHYVKAHHGRLIGEHRRHRQGFLKNHLLSGASADVVESGQRLFTPTPAFLDQ
jgi:flavodoxin